MHDSNPSYPMDIFHSESGRAAEVSFITKLRTLGTLWRWREDPDQHVYETTSGGNYDVPGGSGGKAYKVGIDMPFGRHAWNIHDENDSGTDAVKDGDWWTGYFNRSMFKIKMKRQSDSGAMGAAGGPHNARYTPVNNPDNVGWFDDDGINLAEKGD